MPSFVAAMLATLGFHFLGPRTEFEDGSRFVALSGTGQVGLVSHACAHAQHMRAFSNVISRWWTCSVLYLVQVHYHEPCTYVYYGTSNLVELELDYL